VFPLQARRAAQQVSRAQLCRDIRPLPPFLADLTPQVEHAWREERNADRLAEDGLVAVPPDAGAGALLIHEHVLQLLRLHLGERRGGRSEREEEFGDVVGLPELALREAVVPAQGDDAALARVTIELEVAEEQSAH
jgi:hypothetical protein